MCSEKLNQDTLAKTLTRNYDSIGRPLSISLSGAYSAGYGYDSAGRLSSVWHEPSLGAGGVPQGAPDFTYSYVNKSPQLTLTVDGAPGFPWYDYSARPFVRLCQKSNDQMKAIVFLPLNFPRRKACELERSDK